MGEITILRPVEDGVLARTHNGRPQYLVTCRGRTRTIQDWAAVVGIHWRTLYDRLILAHWPVARALTEPTPIPHGKTGTPEWRVWVKMRVRCNDPAARGYEHYGGRGIKVCPEWEQSFQAFLDHIGPKPGPEYSIDRIDNDRGYEPGNVRWATRAQQARNSSRNVVLEFRGETRILRDWAAEFKIPLSTLWNRLYVLHWTLERALTTTAGKGNEDGDNPP